MNACPAGARMVGCLRRIPMRTLLVLFLLAACADPYGDAQKLDTIEGWEAFLSTEPTGSEKSGAMARLEVLLAEKASKSGEIADFDAFLTRFPKSSRADEIKGQRAAAAFKIAETDDTPEGWKKFVDENPTADGAMKKKATNRVLVAEYKDKLPMGELKMEEVNLANDPKGPKNGWSFTVEVQNTGDRTVDYLNLELQFLGADGAKAGATSYPIVGTTGPGGLPLEEVYTKPLKPGEKRTWNITAGPPPEGVENKAGYIPDGWAKQARVVPVAIRFSGGGGE
jgi:hypothetical protein